ncbi:hypothetical protein JTE90_003286 [Oedothorax gibbosus]|uniref:Protein kinase domain-containing protein n=1 Tax=Oedothorax gibbosus TaxID=931172 RepID=A0AAV6V3I2_9ARAC|nr:hypothetical protein JTE90_003286 [Oedothorax gibbosus]
MTTIENTASDKSCESSEPSPQRSETVRSVLKILKNEKQLMRIKELGKGTYGDVYLMYDSGRKSTIAAKIVTSENIAEAELAFWPKLQHRNIVPLIGLFHVESLDAAVFIMPVQKTNLNDMLYQKQFRKRHDSLDKVKEWLYEILSGLEYLHSQELCHLDLKVDNVLISHSSTAMLCDFTFLNTSVNPLSRYDIGLPYIYRPPEACKTVGADFHIEGKSYDSWGFGVMAVEIFTHFHLSHNLIRSKCWLQDVYPTMYEILQENCFTSLMSSTFLVVHLDKYHAGMALNFIQAFLMVDFTKRVSILEATQHPFLRKGSIYGPKPDAIWKHKISMDIKEFNELYIKYADEYDPSQKEDTYFVKIDGDHEIENEIDDSNSIYFYSNNTLSEVDVGILDVIDSGTEQVDEDPIELGYDEPSEVSYPRSVCSYDSYDTDNEKSVSSSSEHITSFKKFTTYKDSIERFKIRHCEQNKYAVDEHYDKEKFNNTFSSGDKIASNSSCTIDNMEQYGSNNAVEDLDKLEITSIVINKIDTSFTASKAIQDLSQSQISQSDLSISSSKVFEHMGNDIFCSNGFLRCLQIQENIIEGPIFENEPFNEGSKALNDDPHLSDNHSNSCIVKVSPDDKKESKWERGDSMTSIHPLSKVAVDYETPTPLESTTNVCYDKNEHHRNVEDITTAGQLTRQFRYRQLEPDLETDRENLPTTKSPDFCSDFDETILDSITDEIVTIIDKGNKGRRRSVVTWMRQKCSGIEKAMRRRWPKKTKKKQE